MRAPHTFRHVVLMVLQIGMVAAAFTFLLLLAERFNRRFDLSPTQQYALSEAARSIAAELTVPIRITAFYNSQEQGQRREMLDVLQLFTRESANLSYRLVDLDRSPALAQRYGVSNANSAAVELEEGKIEIIRAVDEEEISNAILKLTRRTTPLLCFLSGHGEHTPYDNDDRRGYSEVGKALERENYEIRDLEVIPADGVPPECRVVVVAGPSRDFLPGEADALGRYLGRGGQILFLIDPGAPASAIAFLENHGVRPGNDVVLDERNRLMGTDSSMLHVPAFNRNLFRTELDTAVFPVARTVLPSEEADQSGSVLVVALSSNDSWAYLDEGRLPDGDVRFRRGIDRPGPLPVGVMVTVRPAGAADSGAPTGRMLVFGDSDFATNLSLNWRGNKDLFMSSIAVLAEDPTLVTIRRKGLPRGSISPIFLTEWQDSIVKWVSIVVVPSFFALAGSLVARVRRRRGGR